MDKQLDLTLNSLGVSEPYSIEAEQAILGAAIISPETVSLIIEQVRAEYFYSRQNQRIFLEIHKLFNANIPSDFITVLNSVIANGVFSDEAEAKVYLTQLAETVPSLSNVSSYAKILKDKYLVRMLLNTSADIIKQTQDAPGADELLELVVPPPPPPQPASNAKAENSDKINAKIFFMIFSLLRIISAYHL